MAYGREQAVAIVEQDPQVADEETFPTFYCRALYNYQSTDGSSLSFARGDIIEVLTQLESGWWDGLLGDERGWFPSNYVQRISDVEAEAELAAQYSARAGETRAPAMITSPDMHVSSSDHERNWLQDESDHARMNSAEHKPGGDPKRSIGASNDFWIPQVDQGGQIFYVNTQTGERSRDLPAPTEVGDGHENQVDKIPPSISLSVGRSGSVTRYAGHDEGPASTSNTVYAHKAGFGVNKRSGTPEPWTKRLADDGLTYYYFNKITGQVQWMRPGGIEQSSSTSTLQTSTSETLAPSFRFRADSATSQTQNSGKRDSLYSDDSGIHPREAESRDAYVNGSLAPLDQNRSSMMDDPELTLAERSALLMQASLTPPDPETIDELSDATRDAIIAVMASVDDNGLPKGADHDREVERAVACAVTSIRNLLHISCALSGPFPNVSSVGHADSIPSTAVAQQLQAQLKTSQRKVTATLSKLVLSARAARFKRESLLPETMMRVEQDAADLQRALDKFVTEVKKQYARTAVKQLHQRLGRKRLRGVFDVKHIGLGIPGSGSAASWKGFGFVFSDEGFMPKRMLNDEAILEAEALLQELFESSVLLVASIQDMVRAGYADELSTRVQTLLACIWSIVTFMADINIRQEIDVAGFRNDQHKAIKDPYMQTVDNARAALRSYEASVQSLYDDGMMLFVLLQTVSLSSDRGIGLSELDRASIVTSIYGSLKSVKLEAAIAVDLLGQLLVIAREQTAQETCFRESMALQKSRNSITENRPLPYLPDDPTDLQENEEDIVGMEDAMLKGGRAPMAADYDLRPSLDNSKGEERETEQKTQDHQILPERIELTSMSPASSRVPLEEDPEFLNEGGKAGPPRAAKIRQLLGDDAPERYIEIANADSKPWYLRSDYTKDDLILNPDGGIRAGTMPALIERLTTHEYGDPVFIRTFLMTYKSFTTTTEFCELLIKRFWIEPPGNLKPDELDEWTRLKQNVIRHRVLNTFKTMINDDQVLVEDDLFMLDRVKEFLLDPIVSTSPAAKYLLSTIDRKKQGGLKPHTVTPPSTFPPPPIIPKGMNKNRLKLLDIDPLELARQLTIMEFALYRKIKAIECLKRSRDQKVGEHKDHITDVIQMTNKIANWVNATILSKEDSRKRSALVKQFVVVADRCRNLHNFSSMAAIISGLNAPPIRRLKRTWEQVSGKYMTQLGNCEMTLDSTKNFTNYKATLAQTTAPCIPFIGVYLTTLTFINDGSKDTLPGKLINFGKRQRAAEVIREIQHWQSKDFNLSALPPVLAFIEESLSAFNDSVDWSDHFWNLSLDREPREREDEKMARLLQESGFL